MLGPRRARETTRPDVICPDIEFLRCSSCGRLFCGFGGSGSDKLTVCCSDFAETLSAVSAQSVSGFAFDYSIEGGYDESCVRAFWSCPPETSVELVCLKSYTGYQLKYVPENRKNIIFALADTDAYVYCDENPCLECTFMCKRGFVLYFLLSSGMLIRLPLSRTNALW